MGLIVLDLHVQEIDHQAFSSSLCTTCSPDAGGRSAGWSTRDTWGAGLGGASSGRAARGAALRDHYVQARELAPLAQAILVPEAAWNRVCAVAPYLGGKTCARIAVVRLHPQIMHGHGG